MSDLRKAWDWREKAGFLRDAEAIRVFHGPGDGRGELASVAIDRFGSHYWVTEWESGARGVSQSTREQIIEFLRSKDAASVVALWRPEKGIPAEPVTLFGNPPKARFAVSEGKCRFWIQLLKARHPGLFLDHAPLRRWLERHAGGWKVLNTFAYTGSLSMAAAHGGAEHVTTLDLSKPTVQWAQENWTLNGLSAGRGRFISGDVFEWLPRLKREGKKFDCILLDPPSFSHGNKGRFSTAKDLEKLHSLAMELLTEEGKIITSINSANVPLQKYESDVSAAAKKLGMRFLTLHRIDLPETFPTRLGEPEERYLKGFILQRI